MHKKLILQTYRELAILRERREKADEQGLRIAADLHTRIATVEWQIRMYEQAAS